MREKNYPDISNLRIMKELLEELLLQVQQTRATVAEIRKEAEALGLV